MEVDIPLQYNQDINLYKPTITNNVGNTQYQLIKTFTLPDITTLEYKKYGFNPPLNKKG